MTAVPITPLSERRIIQSVLPRCLTVPFRNLNVNVSVGAPLTHDGASLLTLVGASLLTLVGASLLTHVGASLLTHVGANCAQGIRKADL
jgi:hypothetical protein